MNKILSIGAVLLGIIGIITAIVYFTHGAGSLPTWMPGYETNSSHIHYKHGLGLLILSLGLFAFAWFKSAPTPQENIEPKDLPHEEHI